MFKFFCKITVVMNFINLATLKIKVLLYAMVVSFIMPLFGRMFYFV